MMGALVEVDNVGTSGEYLRGRIVDPTGAFNVYTGNYQPEAFLSLSNLPVPCFVAVVGKTNAYRPDEETTIVSIRPETIVEIYTKTGPLGKRNCSQLWNGLKEASYKRQKKKSINKYARTL